MQYFVTMAGKLSKERKYLNKKIKEVERNLHKDRKKLENPLAADGKIW